MVCELRQFVDYKNLQLNHGHLLLVFSRRNVVNKLFEFKRTHMLQLRKRLTYPLIKKKLLLTWNK